MCKTMLTGLFVLLVGGLMAGCPAPQEAAPVVDAAAEAEAIRGRSAQWMEWARARDAAAIVNEIFTADATTIYDGEVHDGRAAILAGIESEQAQAPDGVVTWTTSHVEVAASGDLAYERGSWTFDPDGAGEAPMENGEYVTIWKKIDGTWRCIVDAGTTIKEEEAGEAAE